MVARNTSFFTLREATYCLSSRNVLLDDLDRPHCAKISGILFAKCSTMASSPFRSVRPRGTIWILIAEKVSVAMLIISTLSSEVHIDGENLLLGPAATDPLLPRYSSEPLTSPTRRRKQRWGALLRGKGLGWRTDERWAAPTTLPRQPTVVKSIMRKCASKKHSRTGS